MKTKRCFYCRSDISADALKCRYCLEWVPEQLHESTDSTSASDDKLEYKSSKNSIQEVVASFTPASSYVNVLISISIAFGLVQLIWTVLGEDPIYLLAFLVFALQGILTWGGIIWFKTNFTQYFDTFQKLTQTSNSESKSVYHGFYNKMFGPKRALTVGVLVGLIASVGDYYMGTPFKTETGKVVFAVYEFFISFWSGAAVLTIVYFASFIRKIGLMELDDHFKYDSIHGVASIGRLHLRTIIVAIIPYLLGISFRLIGDWEWYLGNYIWFGVFAVVIIFYIYWPLFNIHLKMSEDKQKQLKQINDQLKVISIKVTNSPTSLYLNKYFELTQLEASIKKNPTWPFETKNIVGVFFAVVFPIIMMVVDKVFLKP